MTDEQQHEQEQRSIDVKQAVRIATQELRDLYGSTNVELKDLLLEEVEKSGNTWLVTLGFTSPLGDVGSNVGILGMALVSPSQRLSQRTYKRVRIDATSGEFGGMEFRNIPPPDEASVGGWATSAR